MKFGLTDDQYTFIKKVLAQSLGEEVKIFCFGSRANGSFNEFSDLDLMLEDEVEDIKLSNLKETFEESNLPIKVDIALFKKFAESYKKSYLKDRIEF